MACCNGSTINIWSDRWTLEPVHGRIQNPTININYTKVVDLINRKNASWDEAVVKRLFNEETAGDILAIPLSRFFQKDYWIWRGDKTGIYSVRSEYRWFKEAKSGTTDKPSDLQKGFLNT